MLTRLEGLRTARSAPLGFASRWLALALASAVFLTGCGTRGKVAPEAGTPKVVEAKAEKGPVELTVSLGPVPVGFSDEPTLRIQVDYEDGVEIEEPPFGEAVGDFSILDYRREPAGTSERGKRFAIEYRLEPERTGDLLVAPITIRFRDGRESEDPKQYEVETDPLTVSVASVVGDDAPSLADLEEATSPLEIDAPIIIPWLLIGVSVVGLSLLVVGGVWYARRSKGIDAQVLTPRELAYLDLERLISDNLAEIDVKEFYVQLTGIVRVYIERTTGMNAPDQTTEEFLRDVHQSSEFGPEDRARLESFLESADLVKYAAMTPSSEDIEVAFERAKAFIGLEATTEVAA